MWPLRAASIKAVLLFSSILGPLFVFAIVLF